MIYNFTISYTITSEVFKEHLKKCIDITDNNKNLFEVIYVNQFDFNISYQIFDDTGLLLIVDNLTNRGYLDNSIGLWTENKEIIQLLINRFDYGWEKMSSVVKI